MKRGRKSSRIPVAEIEETLFTDGNALGDFFICSDMPMCWSRLGETVHPFVIVIEEDALAAACVDYLRAHGVAEFESAAEIPAPPA